MRSLGAWYDAAETKINNQVAAAFAEIDSDESGFIERKELETLMTKLGHTKIHVLKCERWCPAVLCLSTLCRRSRGISAAVSPCGGLRERLRDLTDAARHGLPTAGASVSLPKSKYIIKKESFFISMIRD